jgi:hypothetical protein
VLLEAAGVGKVVELIQRNPLKMKVSQQGKDNGGFYAWNRT